MIYTDNQVLIQLPINPLSYVILNDRREEEKKVQNVLLRVKQKTEPHGPSIKPQGNDESEAINI